ncbi:(d)CMP kinase [Acholeplasma equirhinis]|uniref:(d)CMP kinase n=1 Tax=Acholeplasma equirhinis TaxID=555393 RepID=UPI00197A8F9E|nr:(d)CMP kinase [Acholeplasma equirhinis]MBN3490563.1 (d)CMP kinase [Acholeplasma equirhinis]
MAGFQVAIDGPAGSGKSTISKLIADRLKMTHIDTGAMYRAVTLIAIERQIDLNDESQYLFLESIRISYHDDHIYVDNRNVEEEIRTKEVTKNVSLVSSFPYVRRKMVELQKMAAEAGDVVMDGRDIGTVVMPNAQVKVFLTAKVEERAKRRHREKLEKGHDVNLEKIVEELVTRDIKDSTRKESPLKKADDAIEIDTTHLTIDQTVEKIIGLIRSAKGEL